MSDQGERAQEYAFSLDPEGDVFLLRDPGTVRLLADPLSFQLLTLLSQPMSLNQIAERVERPRVILEECIADLARHGVIRSVEQPTATDNMEQAYVRVADRYVSPKARQADGEPAATGRSNVLRAAMERYTHWFELDSGDDLPQTYVQYMNDARRRLSVDRVEEFNAKLKALTREFFGEPPHDHDHSHEHRHDDAEEPDYAFFYVLTPVPSATPKDRTK